MRWWVAVLAGSAVVCFVLGGLWLQQHPPRADAAKVRVPVPAWLQQPTSAAAVGAASVATAPDEESDDTPGEPTGNVSLVTEGKYEGLRLQTPAPAAARPARCHEGGAEALENSLLLQQTPAKVVAQRRGLVKLDCRGQWGNRITEYAAARVLAEELNFGLIVCPILLDENFNKGAIFPGIEPLAYDTNLIAGLPSETEKGHAYDVLGLLADRTPRRLHLSGYPFKEEQFFHQYKAQLKHAMRTDLACLTWRQYFPHPDDVVIHLRGYEGCNADNVRAYNPHFQFVDPQFDHYDRILKHMRQHDRPWRQLWMASRCGLDDAYGVARRLQAEYGALLSPQTGTDHSDTGDFIFMMHAKRFIMAQSTFSW